MPVPITITKVVQISTQCDTLEVALEIELLDLLQELCYLPKIDKSFQRQKKINKLGKKQNGTRNS